MKDALHAERPNGNRCLPECGIGLEHFVLCRVAHPEIPEALPLPEGVEVSPGVLVGPGTSLVMLDLNGPRLCSSPSGGEAGRYLLPAEARALAVALIRQAAVAEWGDRHRG